MEGTAIRYCMTRKPEPGEELSEEVFKRLSEAIANEPALLAIEPEMLRYSYEDGYAVVALDGETPIGYTRIHPILADHHPLGGWYELGTTLVLKPYRGLGINLEMYRMLLPRHTQRNIIATTTNGSSLVIGHQMGFVTIPRKKLPEEVWRASCTCPVSKTKSETSGNSGCVLAHTEDQQEGQLSCFFRVTPETAARHGFAPAA